VHALYPRGAGFDMGSGFQTRLPVTGTAQFGSAGERIDGAAAVRLPYTSREVTFRSGDAHLAGSLMLPPGPGPHAAIAFVTGSGPTTRGYLPDLQALLLRGGLAVLAYDKRGIGKSGGFYPGESPTDITLDTLARDAAAAVRFLLRQPEIDPARVGFAGHSQAGWIMPIAAGMERRARFMISFSGPAVTTDETDVYQDLAGVGDTPPTGTPAEIDAAVRKHGPSGFDPLPSIRRARIPMLLIYGALDMQVPTRLSVRRLRPLAADRSRDLTVVVYPKANHALVETATGLTSEMLRSDRFAPGLFPAVTAWIRRHGLATR
jgi:fermentation-respiration switch protein FrsA (DUF1100 family)